MNNHLDLWDVLIGGIYMIIAYVVATSIKKRNIGRNPEYKYYVSGLMAKIWAGIGVCLVYTFYYDGGDTTNYYLGSVAMVNLFFKDSDAFFLVLFGDELGIMLAQFDSETGYPAYYMLRDDKTFAVIRFSCILMFFCFKSFVGVVIVLAVICYSGIFRFYRLLVKLYPGNDKQLAIALLFVPSMVFWGSGLLKDAYTFSAVCWYVTGFYMVFIEKKNVIFNVIVLLVATFFMIQIKPYIFIALLPGSILWGAFENLKRIKSTVLKFVLAPIVIIGFGFGGMFVMSSLAGSMGKFSVETSLERAAITQQDLKRAAYAGNTFDIGDFEPTIPGVMAKAPQAINAGLFRPYIWEARNPVMLLSALENAFLLLASIFILIKLKPARIIKILGQNPYILFAMLFSIFFAFTIGLSTSNFGSLVRYKIPIIPFYVSSLVIMLSYQRQLRKRS